MSQSVSTRTIHTITITVEDQVLSKVEAGDEIEVVLVGRYSRTSPKKLTFRDVDQLLKDDVRF